MDKRAIGVFDSGLGGLSVVSEIIKVLPKENIIYFGDTARVPYGTRSGSVVRKFSFEDANFLLSKKVKCIVIACNTSSAFAAQALKRKLNIPVFEVILPTSHNAVAVSKNKKIGVIGTRGTISSGAYQKALKKINSKTKIVATSCPLFVPFIEEGEFGSALDLVIKEYLKVFKGTKIDTLILGCTHYPVIAKKIKKYMGKGVQLVNPGIEVSKQLKNYLEENNLTSKNTKAKRTYYVSDLTNNFLKVSEMFLGQKIHGNVREVVLGK